MPLIVYSHFNSNNPCNSWAFPTNTDIFFRTQGTRRYNDINYVRRFIKRKKPSVFLLVFSALNCTGRSNELIVQDDKQTNRSKHECIFPKLLVMMLSMRIFSKYPSPLISCLNNNY